MLVCYQKPCGCASMPNMKNNESHTVLVLENIRSAQNVGAIFRTADAIGVEKIYLAGYTPAPVDKFNRPRKELIKTSLGAEKTISWESVSQTSDLIIKLKKKGYTIVAVEQAAGAIDYKTFKPGAYTAFIFGNEVEGVLPETIALSDRAIEIPMHGTKESLNVATTAGIVLFRILDR